MTSATFGDDFSGSGALNGTAGTTGTLAAATWTANAAFARSASGLYLTTSSTSGADYIMTVYPTTTTVATGRSVLEASFLGPVYSIILTFASGDYVWFRLTSTGTWYRVSQSFGSGASTSGTVSARPAGTTSVMRIEVNAGSFFYVYLDGAQVNSWSALDGDSLASIKLQFRSGDGLPVSATTKVLNYVNFKSQTTSGPLGAPPSATPTFTGGVSFSAIGYAGYTASWPAAADASGYEYGFGAAPTSWTDVSLAQTVSLTGRESETFSVRAYGSTGIRSGSLSAVAVLLVDQTAPTWPSGAAITVSSVDARSYALSWPTASDAQVGVAGYSYAVGEITYATGGTSAFVSGRTRGATDHVQVWALDPAGNLSTPLSVDVTLLFSEPQFGSLWPGDTFLTAAAQSALDAAAAAASYFGSGLPAKNALAARVLLAALVALSCEQELTGGLGAAPAPSLLAVARAAVRAWVASPTDPAAKDVGFSAMKALRDLLDGRRYWASSPPYWVATLDAVNASVSAASAFAAGSAADWTATTLAWQTVVAASQAVLTGATNEPLKLPPAYSSFWTGFEGAYETP
jgi:hypothetical protein